MPLQVNDVLLVTYRMSWNQQRYLSTWTWRVNENTMPTDTPTEVANVAAHFAINAAGTPMMRMAGAIAQNVVFADVRAQKISGIRSVFRNATPGLPAGTFAADATTGNVAAVGTLRTAIAGRNQVANKHIGPIPNTGYTAGQVTIPLGTAVALLLVAMTTNQVATSNGGTITLVPCIFHRSSGTSDDAISSVFSDRIGTMRRRTLRVGE